jgi:hypothetical protein
MSLEVLKTDNKVKLALLFIVSVVLTFYTASAHYVASFVYELHGHLFWPNTLGGSFIPWPYLPSGIAGQMLTLLNQVDTQYYTYVIRSGVLIYVTVALWAIVLWQFWKTRKSLKKI